MNQLSQIGFGTNIQVCAGYAQATGDRLGPVDFVIHNTGNNALTLQLREHDGTTSPSGYKNVVGVSAFTTIVAGGVATLHTTLLGKQVGFFGSGSTTANISPVLRNKADLRGAQIDSDGTTPSTRVRSVRPAGARLRTLQATQSRNHYGSQKSPAARRGFFLP